MTPVRSAIAADIDSIAQVWHDGWQDAHAAILPPALARFRTLERFRARAARALGRTRAVGPDGAVLGFAMVKGDELDQLYVSRAARGTGIAAALLADAEQRLAAAGIHTAWLACAIGNDRAARFYEKSGWRRIGVFVHRAETPEGPFELEAWRYEKVVGG
jgi:GNAT superfamily N-acetyltransferase